MAHPQAANLTNWLAKVFAGETVVSNEKGDKADLSKVVFVCAATNNIQINCLPDDQSGWRNDCLSAA
ncbi:MAG: hypothetical protein J0653_06485, partial [Deltaproteobacteria bacterium]|nr:hypothetical protein [Deltaproteobacteria bacterium]